MERKNLLDMEFFCRLQVTDLETIQWIQIIAKLSLKYCKQLKDSDCVLPDDLPSN